MLDGRRHLTNTIEASMCVGDAAFLSDYFGHLFCNRHSINSQMMMMVVVVVVMVRR